MQIFVEAIQWSTLIIIQSKLILWWRQYDAIGKRHVAKKPHESKFPTGKVFAPAFSRQTAWRRACKPHASYKAVSTATWHHQHLFQFTDPGVQHSLFLFRLGSPPLLHLLDLSLVLNLVRRHLLINKMGKNWLISRTGQVGVPTKPIQNFPSFKRGYHGIFTVWKPKYTRRNVLSNEFEG